MRVTGWLTAAVIVLAAVVTWFPTWSAPYAEDDFLFLEAVSRPGAPPPVHYLTHEGVMDHHYRPLADPLLFALLHAVAGADPIAYHVVLLVVHLLAAGLVVVLARALSLSPAVALGAGVIYVTRDLAFPSMVWASGFSDIGSAAAALGALCALARWSRRGGSGPLLLAVALMLLAQLIKETAVVTIGLVPIVLMATGASRRRVLLGTLPVVVLGVPLALAALRLARFAEGGGQVLYELSLGPHVLALWPLYAAWSLAGVREILEVAALRWALIAAGYAGLIALAVAAARHVEGARRTLLIGGAWLLVAAAPALLAPNRVHTNYLALAAVGPILALARALAALTARRRWPGLLAWGAVIAAGPLLVQAKAGGHLASGGWVDTAKAERLDALVEGLEAALPSPAPGARLLVFGGMAVDVRVLGDPRGAGFGPQQVLASAIRVRYGRDDLEVLSLPPVDRSPPAAFDAVHALLGERPETTRVIVAAEDVRDVTARALAVLGEGGDARDLARALAGS